MIAITCPLKRPQQRPKFVNTSHATASLKIPVASCLLKQRRGQVSLAGIGEDYHDQLPLVLRATGDLATGEGGSAPGNADQEPLLARELPRDLESLVVFHLEDLVVDPVS